MELLFVSIAAGFLLLIVILFQLALACGAPWGSIAMGGKYPGRFPNHMRIAALLQSLLLVLIGVIIFTRAGIILSAYLDWSRMAIWGVVAYSLVGSILNLITPSKWERRIWAPVVLALLACSSVVALSA
ncbi:MAG: hypothetical protein WA071_05965 [Undibacterium umbellatum]|uniref:hypothetical protein n=1 Tax=Undibacterium umbellatum TaxID=2762300 RepID=UPI003BB7A185